MINIFDFYSIVSLLGIGQGVFLFVYFLLKKNLQTLEKLILLALIFVFTFKISHDFLMHSSLIMSFPNFTFLGSLFLYLFGPLIYLFTKRVVDKNSKFTFKTLAHFLPFIVFNISRIPKYLLPAEEKLKQLSSFYSLLGNDPEQLVINPSFFSILKDFVLWYSHPLVYVVFSILLVAKYSKTLKNFYSNTENLQLKWLRNILVIYSIIILTQFAVYIYSMLSETVYLLYRPVTNIFLSILIYSLTYLSLKKHSAEIPDKEISNSKLLDKDKAKNYLEIILHKVEDEKLYLDPKFTIQKLSEKVDIPPRYVSEVINSELKKNFYDFINEYRVKDSANLLKNSDYDNYKIEAIGKEAGFSSQAVFYKTFKKHFKTTPSEYRKS